MKSQGENVMLILSFTLTVVPLALEVCVLCVDVSVFDVLHKVVEVVPTTGASFPVTLQERSWCRMIWCQGTWHAPSVLVCMVAHMYSQGEEAILILSFTLTVVPLTLEVCVLCVNVPVLDVLNEVVNVVRTIGASVPVTPPDIHEESFLNAVEMSMEEPLLGNGAKQIYNKSASKVHGWAPHVT